MSTKTHSAADFIMASPNLEKLDPSGNDFDTNPCAALLIFTFPFERTAENSIIDAPTWSDIPPLERTAMLPIFGAQARLCDLVTRREMLRMGGLGALGLSLPGLLTLQQTRAADDQPATNQPTAASFGKAKSCIVLFLMGGP